MGHPEPFAVYPAEEYSEVEIPREQFFADGGLDIYPETLPYFSFELRAGGLTLSTRGIVGDIPLNPRARVEVSPRVRIANLERMFSVGKGVPLQLEEFMRAYPPHEVAAASLADVFAGALASAVSEIEALGLHREYVRAEQRTSFPRGRILTGRTLELAARGIEHQAVATWFAPTVDTAPNRALKDALLVCAERYARQKQRTHFQTQLLNRLQLALRTFDAVSLDPDRGWLTDVEVVDPTRIPAHRSYYSPALQLAVAIVSGHGVQFRGPEGILRLPSLLLNLETVFEAYVRRLLRERQQQFSCIVLDGAFDPPAGARRGLFDDRRHPETEPDMVIRSAAEDTKPVVVEVKYKPLEDLPSREDLNQAITYAVVYRASSIVLVQPAGRHGRPGLRRLGTIGEMDAYVYAFDLNATDIGRAELAYVEDLFRLVAAGGAGLAA